MTNVRDRHTALQASGRHLSKPTLDLIWRPGGKRGGTDDRCCYDSFIISRGYPAESRATTHPPPRRFFTQRHVESRGTPRPRERARGDPDSAILSLPIEKRESRRNSFLQGDRAAVGTARADFSGHPWIVAASLFELIPAQSGNFSIFGPNLAIFDILLLQ